MIAGFFTCSTVAEAASWTYPDDMADLPYYEGLGTEESPYLINWRNSWPTWLGTSTMVQAMRACILPLLRTST